MYARGPEIRSRLAPSASSLRRSRGLPATPAGRRNVPPTPLTALPAAIAAAVPAPPPLAAADGHPQRVNAAGLTTESGRVCVTGAGGAGRGGCRCAAGRSVRLARAVVCEWWEREEFGERE